MRSIIATASVAILCLSGVVMPAWAEGGGYARRHARTVRLHGPSRDPYLVASRHQGPDYLIQAYLPRTTETPIYNEPPSRFPPR